MEEKKDQIRDSFWSFFNSRNFSFSSVSRRNKSNNSKGFTLVEIIIAIAVIGILAATFIAVINPALQLKRSRDSDRKSDIKLMQSALELHRSDIGSYPTPVSNSINNCSGKFEGVDVDNPCGDVDNSVYLQTIPVDPKSGSNYYYCVTTACGAPTNGYAIYACLENSSEALVANEVLSSVPASTITCPSGTTRFYKATNP